MPKFFEFIQEFIFGLAVKKAFCLIQAISS